MPKNKKTSSVPPLVANRYFAIEALKRSKKMKGYPPGSLSRTNICAKCGINEGWLEGNDHERYLSRSSWEDSESNRDLCNKDLNNYDLKLFAKTPLSEPLIEPRRNSLEAVILPYLGHDPDGQQEIDGEDKVLALLRDPTPEWLCLALPMREKPKKLIKLLMPFLKQRHAEAIKYPKNIGTIIWEERHKNYFEDISAWRRNLQCYDLRDTGMSEKEIASKVFPNWKEEFKKALQNVKSGIKQVRHMIKCAEKGTWPPNR